MSHFLNIWHQITPQDKVFDIHFKGLTQEKKQKHKIKSQPEK